MSPPPPTMRLSRASRHHQSSSDPIISKTGNGGFMEGAQRDIRTLAEYVKGLVNPSPPNPQPLGPNPQPLNPDPQSLGFDPQPQQQEPPPSPRIAQIQMRGRRNSSP
ncbi:hypothetical protein FRB95_003507 [Tulasnella sp. JGI-2019a]|nr:hypothetical protein FRB95_003507 [Tulasnella sp. JGI-2019a]